MFGLDKNCLTLPLVLDTIHQFNRLVGVKYFEKPIKLYTIPNIFLSNVTAARLKDFGIIDGQCTPNVGVKDAEADAEASLKRA